MSAPVILSMDHVVKIYRSRGSLFGRGGKEVVALNDVSLEILQGEIFGLVGESGSGKTTAGRLIVRLERAESGRIFLNGEETTHLRGRALKRFRRQVQMIFQDPYQSLNAQLSVFDTVCEPLSIHGIGKARQREEKVCAMLKAVGLSPPEDFLGRYPHRLSGGQRQRVAIARAMILDPVFVVADEPTSMLDASISAQIFNILLEMRARLGVTLLFITHSLAAARYLCDRIGVIYRGTLMELGPADTIIHRPMHPYTQALIDALPKFGQCGRLRVYGTLRPLERKHARGGCIFFARCGRGREESCGRAQPALRPVGGGHLVACHHADLHAAAPQDASSCYAA